MIDDRAAHSHAGGGNGSPAGTASSRNPFRWVRTHNVGITLFFLVASFIFVAMWDLIFVPKRAGEQGVYWSRFFGGTSDMILGEGTHLKFPWDEVTLYDTRIMVVGQKTLMLTKDGMQLEVEWSTRYRVKQDELPQLHRTIGPRYQEKFIIPEVISSLRQILGNYTAEEIYARDELSLITEIETRTHQQFVGRPIVLEAVLLLRIDMPKEMAKSIVDKLITEQALLSYAYRLKSEEEERKRKTIEAEGIRAFEETSKISILKWRGIDATTELAKSPNTKIIIMGTGPNGMPLLLNADK